MVHFTCPKCGAKYRGQPALAGRSFPCRGCKVRLDVPYAEVPPEEEVDELEEVPEEGEELEEVDEPYEVLPEVDDEPPLPLVPAPRDAHRYRLVVHGKNGSVELVGHDLVVHHDGTFGTFGTRIRGGTSRHPVVSITEIEFAEPGSLDDGRIRFVVGREKEDTAVAFVLDARTILFGSADRADFLYFKKEVERLRGMLIADIGMNTR
jgi:hypothetical protein